MHIREGRGLNSLWCVFLGFPIIVAGAFEVDFNPGFLTTAVTDSGFVVVFGVPF